MISASGYANGELLLNWVFSHEGFYEQLADRLVDAVPLRRRITRGHWLCGQLNDLAAAVEPTTYTQGAGRLTGQILLDAGSPRFIAEVLGAGAGLGLELSLAQQPITQLARALRVLIPLVCPDLAACPTRRDVVKTFAVPALAAQLHAIARSP